MASTLTQPSVLGVFDSGVGGFSVLTELRKCTNADIVYFGDCANAPYGNKSSAEILRFVENSLTLLQQKGVTHFVSACNSMSVYTTKALLAKCGISEAHYVDMVSSMKEIVFPHKSRVLIVGTVATMTSHVYQSLLCTKGVVFDVFSPKNLAGEIESGDNVAIERSVFSVMEEVKRSQATHVIYACTHYPLAHDVFVRERDKAGLSCELVDPAEYTAGLVGSWSLVGAGTTHFETSKHTPVFDAFVADFEQRN